MAAAQIGLKDKKTPITQFIARWQSSVMDDVWIPLVKSLCRILCFCFHSAEFSDQQESASVKCRIFRSNPTVGRYLCCRSHCHGHQPVNQHLKDLAVFISQKESCVVKTKKRRQIASYRRLIGRRDSDSSTIPFYFQSTSDPSSPLSRLNLGSGKNRSSIPTLSHLSTGGLSGR